MHQCTVLIIVLLAARHALAFAGGGPASGAPAKSDVRAKLAEFSVPFMANDGQADARVAFYAPTLAGTVFVTKNGELVYSLPGPVNENKEKRSGEDAGQPRPGWTLVERFDRGSPHP